MKYRTLKPLAAALLLASTSALAASPFDQLVVFGDSLSDSGQFPDAGGPINPDYGVPASGLRFTSREDGLGSKTELVGVQRLSEALGLGYLAASTPYLPSPVTGYPAGTNYAVGGNTSAQIKASITDPDGSVVYNPAAGPAQVRDGYLAEYGSARATTLYYVNGGGNDVLALSDPFDPTNAGNVVAAANQLVQGISALDAAGAQYIMVSNLPDVGNTPAGIASGAQPLWTPMSELYNDTLYAGLKASGANIIPVDTRGLVAEIVADPAEFGFMTDTQQLLGTCYDGTGGSCLENPMYGILQANAGDQSKLIFNDGVHPTAAAQQIVADYMYSLIRAPQEVGQLPLLGASLVDNTINSTRQQMQANLAAKKLGEGSWQIFSRGNNTKLKLKQAYVPSTVNGSGVVLGVQYGISDAWSLGVGLSSDDGKLTFDDTGSRAEANSVSVNLFTGYVANNHWFNASAYYSKQEYTSIDRVVPLGITQRIESGETTGDAWALSAEYGYNISPHSNWDYGPKLELSTRSLSVDGYSEKDGLTTSLTYGSQENDSTIADLGLFVHWRAFSDQLVLTSEWGIRSQLSGKDYQLQMASQTLDTNPYYLPAYQQDKGESWYGNLNASYYISDTFGFTGSWQRDSGDQRQDVWTIGISLAF